MEKRSQIFLAISLTVAILLVVSMVYIGFGRHKTKLSRRSDLTTSAFPTEFQEPVTPTLAAPSRTPSEEFPKLYPGAQWESPKPQLFTFVLRPGDSMDIEGVIATSSLPLKTYPSDFIDYYTRELTEREWVQTSVVDGESHRDFWRKNGYYFVFGFRSSYYPEKHVLFVEHN